MKTGTEHIVSVLLIILGIFLAFASKVLLPVEIRSFWRILTEIGGYVLIAGGCGIFGITGKPKE